MLNFFLIHEAIMISKIYVRMLFCWYHHFFVILFFSYSSYLSLFLQENEKKRFNKNLKIMATKNIKTNNRKESQVVQLGKLISQSQVELPSLNAPFARA